MSKVQSSVNLNNRECFGERTEVSLETELPDRLIKRVGAVVVPVYAIVSES